MIKSLKGRSVSRLGGFAADFSQHYKAKMTSSQVDNMSALLEFG